MQDIKANIRGVIAGVLNGRVDKGVGAVIFTGFNTLLRAVETERRARELEEVADRLATLENELERGARRFGRPV